MPTQPEPETSQLRRSQRAIVPPQRFIESLEAQVYEETLYERDMSTEFEG